VLIVWGNTQKNQSCVCALAGISGLIFRVTLGSESTGEEEKTFFQREKGSGSVDFSEFN